MRMLFESSSFRSEFCAPNERKDGANPTDARSRQGSLETTYG